MSAAIRLPYAEDRIGGLIILSEVITERKQAETALDRRAAELATVNRLIKRVNASLEPAQVAQAVLDQSLRVIERTAQLDAARAPHRRGGGSVHN